MLTSASQTPSCWWTPGRYPVFRGLFQGWVLDVVLGGVRVGQPIHDIEPLAVGVVDLDERLPLVRERILREDRLDGALGFARPAVDALLGVDHEDAIRLMDAVDRADVDTREIFDVDAGLGDDVRHGAVTLLRRSAPRRSEARAPGAHS